MLKVFESQNKVLLSLEAENNSLQKQKIDFENKVSAEFEIHMRTLKKLLR